jgi:hypothetical protein
MQNANANVNANAIAKNAMQSTQNQNNDKDDVVNFQPTAYAVFILCPTNGESASARSSDDYGVV